MMKRSPVLNAVRHRVWVISVGISMALSYTPAGWAQQNWTLGQVMTAAWNEDATLRAARAAAAASSERLPQAQAQLKPSLGFSAGRTLNDLSRTQPNFLGKVTTTEDRYLSYNQLLQLRQPLYRKSAWVTVEQAENELRAAQSELSRQERGLSERVTAAFVEALAAQDQADWVEAQKRYWIQQRQAAEKALTAGTGTRTDIDEAQSRLDLIAAQELEAQQLRMANLRQLSNFVNAPIEAVVPLNVPKFQVEGLDVDPLPLWLERAAQANAELETLKAQREVARLEIEKAEAGHHPTLDAIAQWTRSASENVSSPASSYTNRSIGLQLNLPLYGGGYQSSMVRQARSNLVRAEEALEAAQRDLSLKVHKEFNGLTQGRLKVKALEQAVRSAQQLVRSSRLSFQAGERSVLDILNAEQQEQQTRRDLSQARYALIMALVRLMTLSGQEWAAIEAILGPWFDPQKGSGA